ncbi:MAG: ABC-2 transporter permease [candidate division WOR-3 bacterium]
MRALLWKDFKITKWWIFSNILIISSLGGIGLYLSYYRNFPGFIPVLLSGVGIFFWSFISGMAHYFNEDNGNLREFLNTLPVHRWKILLSKWILLAVENSLYWLLFFLFLYLSARPFISTGDYSVNGIIVSYILSLLTTLTISSLSLSMSSFTKELPARWFLTVLLVILSLIALQFIPAPKITFKITEMYLGENVKPYVDIGYTVKNFLVSLCVLVVSSFWVSKRGI